MADLTTAMKEKGDKGTYSTNSPPARVVGAMYKAAAGLNTVEVQYRSSRGNAQRRRQRSRRFAICDPVFATIQSKQGKIRVLAVATGERLKSSPDYPAMTELGYKMNLVSWWGAMVPAGTPRPIVEKLRSAFATVISSEEGIKFLNSIASDPWVIGPEEAQDLLAQGSGRLARAYEGRRRSGPAGMGSLRAPFHCSILPWFRTPKPGFELLNFRDATLKMPGLIGVARTAHAVAVGRIKANERHGAAIAGLSLSAVASAVSPPRVFVPARPRRRPVRTRSNALAKSVRACRSGRVR